MTSTTSGRRGFLRGLASLPLIGGGVQLLGSPTAAAVPITESLMLRYLAFVAREHAEILVELEEIKHPGEPVHARWQRDWVSDNAVFSRWVRQPLYWFPDDPTAHTAVTAARPSTRAAVVLSAAGCRWRG